MRNDQHAVPMGMRRCASWDPTLGVCFLSARSFWTGTWVSKAMVEFSAWLLRNMTPLLTGRESRSTRSRAGLTHYCIRQPWESSGPTPTSHHTIESVQLILTSSWCQQPRFHFQDQQTRPWPAIPPNTGTDGSLRHLAMSAHQTFPS